jgi:hypothetical protein
MAFTGSCHCGNVLFSVDADPPARAMSCNCSHCRRKGFLLAFIAPEQLTVSQGRDALKTYLFNKHAIAHQFCTTCGVEPFAEGKGPGGKTMCAVNLRCVPAIDLDALEIQKVDGASF